jgi:hypothetical protein
LRRAAVSREAEEVDESEAVEWAAVANRMRTGRRKVEVAAMERAMDGDGDGVALEFRRTSWDICVRKSSVSIFSLCSFSISLCFLVCKISTSLGFRLGISDNFFSSAESEKDLVPMATSASFTFTILKFSKSYTFMSPKIVTLNIYADIYMTSVFKKVPLKNTLYFRKYIEKTNL